MVAPTEGEAKRYRVRAVSERDADFLFELKRSAYRAHVEATWGQWDEAWQRERFMSRFDPASTRIVVVDGRDVGALSVAWDRDPVFFASVELIPDARRQGIGTEIIKDVLLRARDLGRAAELQVLKTNADARTLYERLGFVVTGESDTHTQMAWAPE